jgi:hypothetical protein
VILTCDGIERDHGAEVRARIEAEAFDGDARRERLAAESFLNRPTCPAGWAVRCRANLSIYFLISSNIPFAFVINFPNSSKSDRAK